MKNEALRSKREFVNVRALVEWAARSYADDCAYSYKLNSTDREVAKVSFTKLRDDVRALSSALLVMGCAGKHIMLVGKLSYDWALLYYSAFSIGAVLVPADPEWSFEEICETAKFADVCYVFCDVDIFEKAEHLKKKVKLSAAPVGINAKHGEGGLENLIIEGRSIFRKTPNLYFDAPIDPKGMSLMAFTSGTTGKGKGVMLTQEGILSNIADVIPYIDFSRKTVAVLPPHHTYGSSVTFIGHLMVGAEVYISCGIRYIQRELKEQKPGHLVLVPLYLETFYKRIMATVKDKGKEELFDKTVKASNALRKVRVDLRGEMFAPIRNAFGGELKTIICGGAPINKEIIEFFESIGISTLNGYGITECSPIVAVNRSRRNTVGSVGPVIDIDRVKIANANLDGEGEICVKGVNVMLGYYKDPKATMDAFDGAGYFKTGDYGRMDENGNLHITGRKKNLIILSSGKNVYPEEIENALAFVPGISDVVVYEGQSIRGRSNNCTVCEIFPDFDYISKNAVSDSYAYFKKHIDDFNRKSAPYKRIGLLRIRSCDFPKNSMKKIQRYKIDTEID